MLQRVNVGNQIALNNFIFQYSPDISVYITKHQTLYRNYKNEYQCFISIEDSLSAIKYITTRISVVCIIVSALEISNLVYRQCDNLKERYWLFAKQAKLTLLVRLIY